MEGEDAGGGAGEEERGLRWVGEWMCVCVCGLLGCLAWWVTVHDFSARAPGKSSPTTCELSFQRISSARSEGYQEGQAAAQKEVAQTQAAAPTTASVPPEVIQMKVKAIMNQTYQTLATKFKTRESFETKEILNILVTTIKVLVIVCLIRECVWVKY